MCVASFFLCIIYLMSKKLTYLIVILFLIFLSAVSFILLKNYINSKKPVIEEKQSPFSDLIKKDKQFSGELNEYDIDLDNLEESFESSISSLIEKQGHFIDWDEPWNWEDSWFMATIQDINKNTINLEFTYPDQLKDTIKEVPYECIENQTLVMSRYNLELIGSHINIYEKAKPGFLIFSHCLDENCSSIGNGCVIVDMEQ